MGCGAAAGVGREGTVLWDVPVFLTNIANRFI